MTCFLHLRTNTSASEYTGPGLYGVHDVINLLVVERSQDVNARGFDKLLTSLLACHGAHLKFSRLLLEHDVESL